MITMKYNISWKAGRQQLGGVPITGCRVAWVGSSASLPIPHHGDDYNSIKTMITKLITLMMMLRVETSKGLLARSSW